MNQSVRPCSMRIKLAKPNVKARYVPYPMRISNQRRPIHSR